MIDFVICNVHRFIYFCVPCCMVFDFNYNFFLCFIKQILYEGWVNQIWNMHFRIFILNLMNLINLYILRHMNTKIFLFFFMLVAWKLRFSRYFAEGKSFFFLLAWKIMYVLVSKFIFSLVGIHSSNSPRSTDFPLVSGICPLVHK